MRYFRLLLIRLLSMLAYKPFRHFFIPKGGRESKVESGSICIVLAGNNRLGDLVIHNFLAQQLTRLKYKATFCVSEGFYDQYAFFFKEHTICRDVLVMPKSPFHWLSFVKEIKNKKISAVILDYLPQVGPEMFFLAQVPLIIAPAEVNSKAVTRSYEVDKLNVHFTELVPFMCGLLGREVIGKHVIEPFLPFKKLDTKEINNLKNEGKRVIAVHMGGSNHWNRKWPLDKFIDICERFIEKYKGAIMLIGGADEYENNEVVKDWLSDKGSVIENCSTNDINKTASVLSVCDVFVGNDSGPLHIANALNKRVIGIYGPSAIPVVNTVKYDERNAMVYLDLPCVPCMKTTCDLADPDKLSCLKKLQPDAVWEKLVLALGEKHGNSDTNYSASKKYRIA